MTGATSPPDPLVSAVADVVRGRVPAVPDTATGPLARRLERLGVAGLAIADHRAREDAGAVGGLHPTLFAELLPTYHRTALHTTLVLESARRVRGVLSGAGVPSLVFKGAALHRIGVYADPGARPLEDTDVLVHPSDAERAVRALGDAGFVPWEPWTARHPMWSSAFSFSDPHRADGVEPAVDLHWATPYARLRHGGPWRPDPLWVGATDGVPAPEAHFAVLAEHVLKHLRVVAHVRGIADLARMASRLEDGQELRRQAEARRSLPGLRLVVGWLRDVLRVSFAAPVTAALGIPAAPRLRGWARLAPERLFAEAGAAPSRAGGVLGDWWLLGSPRDSMTELARVLVPSGRWLRARYPEQRASVGRLRYLRELAAWAFRDGRSPLSPNQELEA